MNVKNEVTAGPWSEMMARRFSAEMLGPPDGDDDQFGVRKALWANPDFALDRALAIVKRELEQK